MHHRGLEREACQSGTHQLNTEQSLPGNLQRKGVPKNLSQRAYPCLCLVVLNSAGNSTQNPMPRYDILCVYTYAGDDDTCKHACTQSCALHSNTQRPDAEKHEALLRGQQPRCRPEANTGGQRPTHGRITVPVGRRQRRLALLAMALVLVHPRLRMRHRRRHHRVLHQPRRTRPVISRVTTHHAHRVGVIR